MKRFRTRSGRLSMSLKKIAAATLEEAKAYYIEGEQYTCQGEILTCYRDQTHYWFRHRGGRAKIILISRIGLYLPDVAEDGMEITRVEGGREHDTNE